MLNWLKRLFREDEKQIGLPEIKTKFKMPSVKPPRGLQRRKYPTFKNSKGVARRNYSSCNNKN